MQLNRVDLNLYVVFEAIYSEGNLTRAAEVLHVTQPTVSNALARLRAVYDDRLFVRSGRGVVPTPLAQRMIEPVRRALRLMQASLDSALDFDPETADRSFRIGAGDVTSSAVLPGLMASIARSAPNVGVQCFQLDRPEIVHALAAGDLDVAIDIPQLSATALNRHELFESDHVCVMRKGHPAQRGPWTLERFLSLGHVTVSSRPSGSGLLELAMSRLGTRLSPKLRVQHYLTGFEVVQASDLVMLAPRSLARRQNVRAKELPFEQPSIGSWLFWHRNADEDPANRWLRSQIINASTTPLRG